MARTLSVAEVLGQEEEAPASSSASKLTSPDTTFGTSKLFEGQRKEFSAIGDMILGFPAFLAKMGTRGVVSAQAALMGEEEPATYAAEVIDPAMEAPWMKLLSNPIEFLTKTPKDDTLVDKFGKAISAPVERAAQYWADKTGREDVGEAVRQSLDVLMGAGGDVVVKGVRAAKGAMKGKESAPEVKMPVEEAPDITGNLHQAGPLSVAEVIAQNTGLDRTGPSSKAAKSRVTKAFKEPAEGSDFLDIGESVFRAEERSRNRELWAQERMERAAKVPEEGSFPPGEGVQKTRIVEPTILFSKADDLQSALGKQRAGKSFDMTAAEKIALRDFGKRTVTLQEGKIDQDLLLGMGAAALGLGVAALDEDQRNAALGMGVMLLGSTRAKGESLSNVMANAGKATAESAIKVQGWDGWQFKQGEQLRSAETGERYKVAQQTWDTHADKPVYLVEQVGGDGAFRILDADKAHELMKPLLPEEVGPGAAEQGKIDPDLLKKVAAISGGAALGAYAADKDKLGAALMGALVGFGLSSVSGKAALRDVGEGAAKTLGALSTELKGLSEPLHHRHIKLEMNTLKRTHDELKIGDAFFARMEKLKGNTLLRGLRKSPVEAVELALTQNDFGALGIALKKLNDPLLTVAWPKVREQLVRLGKDAQDRGLFKGVREDYFPRVVKDYKGLQSVLEPLAKDVLDKEIRAAEVAALKAGRGGLDSAERSVIINEYLRRKGATSFIPSFAKGRHIEQITPELQQFYQSPLDAYHGYINKSVRDSEAAAFFGKDLKLMKKGEHRYTDFDASIGAIIESERAAGRLKGEDLEKLRSIEKARFGGGDKPMWWFWQDVKNVTAAGLLGNMVAAVGQYADIGPILYAQGIKPTLAAGAGMLMGKKPVTAADLGLINHVAEEFVSTRPSAQLVNWVFTHSLMGKHFTFSGADMNMKELDVNAALIKGKNWVTKGDPRLVEKYKEAFGPEFPALVKGLKEGKLTPETSAFLFHELSRTQPISKLEMPQWALENPNGRLLLSMKTWMLKQMDLVRRDVWQEYGKGNKKTALTNMMKIGAAYGIAGASMAQVQNWMLGRDSDLEMSDVYENMMKTFALNAYTRDRVKHGKAVEAAVTTVIPPYKMYDEILRRDPKIIRYLPDIGPILYAQYFGGAEKFNKAEAARKRKEAR